MKKVNYIKRPEDGEPIFTLVKDTIGRGWLYPINSLNPGDEILCTDSANWDLAGEGFGGSTLKCKLEDGTIFELKGGWHSNSGSLLVSTGIDLTNKNFTRCIIAKELITGWPSYVLDDIIHEEQDWVLGDFERSEKLAKNFANELGQKVFCFTQSLGGRSTRWIFPDTVLENEV